jgi:hypothetical protein
MLTPVGEEVFVPCTEIGGYVCPVCAFIAADSGDLAWRQAGSVESALALRNARPVEGVPSFDICPLCSTQFGLDDVSETQQTWKAWRDQWREAHSQDPKTIERLDALERALAAAGVR